MTVKKSLKIPKG